ncbi:HD domain-containing protein [Maritalea porphyrae]|uniref:HD domain-containing protein n=1 Tax=Maritalea porphyrae TaxID=880732 RepID=UPI0022AEA474|nr:HD domain-containing protein [Maritalea porphyrae]MCZ4271774.1 HD domain-containing protein [Maritalea porphyrae]
MTTEMPQLKINDHRLEKQIAFVMEMDKLKAVDRMTKIICEDRVENDAEHSWHVALMALVLEPYAGEKVNIERVIKMLLVHDVVEIDAGDTYIYAGADAAEQFETERKAANRIFGLLPDNQAQELTQLWQEFEARETAEAKFAKAIDRLSPYIYYGFAGEGCWVDQGVDEAMVCGQMVSMNDVSVDLKNLYETLLKTYQDFGVVRDSKNPTIEPENQHKQLADHMRTVQFTNVDLTKRIHFVMEMDKLKSIIRQTQLVSVDRLENDAEHSWNLAIMAVILKEHANMDVNLLRVLKMLLIHDIVEIDAGDAPIHDLEAQKGKEKREIDAANRLFGMLPSDFGDELKLLWEEFEAHKSDDAQFARAMDRLSPLLYSFHTKGVRWTYFDVNEDKVRMRNGAIQDGSQTLWALAKTIIEQCVEAGYLKRCA